MGVRLVIRPRAGHEQTEATYDFDQSRIVIGRGSGADVRLPHPSVSHAHAVIREQGVGYVLVDDGSTNGTRVNGQPVVTGRPKRLRDGDRITVGAFVAVFHAGLAVADGTSAEGTAALARHLVRTLWDDGQGTEAMPRLRVSEGPDEGRTLALPPPSGRLVVGRGETCDLVLHDADVSREHVAIAHERTGARVLDLDSKNGMHVNDRPVTERSLRDGDEVRIGVTRLVFEDPAEERLRAIEQEADAHLDMNDDGAPEESPDEATGTTEPPRDPEPQAAPLPRRPRNRPGGTDLAIYVLAGSVFALSLVGLLLLLRG